MQCFHPVLNYNYLFQISNIKRCVNCLFKMISMQHSSNNGKSYVTKKASLHGNIFNKGKKILSNLSSQADPMRDNWTWSYTYFNSSACFAFVENTIAHTESIFTRFDIKFLKNAWGFHRGVTWRNELQCAVSRFLVNNFCTYCSNFEQNLS